MNIFVTSPNPVVCAKVLDDSRVIKMTLESAQMLSTCLRLRNISDAPYKEFGRNHPCNIWVRESPENYDWLFDHFISLCKEYRDRFGKEHDCYRHATVFSNYRSKESNYNETMRFCDVSNIFYPDLTVFQRYALCLVSKWNNAKKIPRWNRIPLEKKAREDMLVYVLNNYSCNRLITTDVEKIMRSVL